jgi:hypothetical protein
LSGIKIIKIILAKKDNHDTLPKDPDSFRPETTRQKKRLRPSNRGAS